MTFEYMENHLNNVKQYGVTVDTIILELEKDVERFTREINSGNNVEAFRKERAMFLESITDWKTYKTAKGL